jgi:ribosome biogenesis GTPase
VVLEGERSARLAPRLAADPNTSIVVGDEVAWSEREGVVVVEGVVPRRSCLARSDPGDTRRQLAIAANVDVAVIVVAAADPPLHVGLIDRVLLGLEGAGVAPLVCVTKLDLLDTEARAALEHELAPYAELEVPVLRCSAESGEGVDELRASLQGRTCVFVGHSGVGKSTLLNLLDPAGDRPTGDVRERDGRGRHTTTGSSLRELEGGTRVIDTPGVRAFGLERLTLAQVQDGFADLAAFASGCRFADCSHLSEPDCAVRDAAEDGRVSESRYRSYARIVADLV